MKVSTFALVVLAALVLSTSVDALGHGRFRPRRAAVPTAEPGSSSSSSSSDPSAEFYYNEQLVDHFDDSNTAVWSQRYYVNESYWNGTGPVFLCVGGETPLTPLVALDGDYHCAWAFLLTQYYGGLFVALEHRFYGKSMPMPDLSTSSLAVLSSRQALADLDQFVGFLSIMRTLKPSNVIFTFGGSYPGMLAGWARLQLPSTVFAAVASSAPVQAAANYYGYNDIVHAALEYPWDNVGGSAACAAELKLAYAELGAALLTAEGQSSLSEAFNVCPNAALSNSSNWVVFAEAVGGVIFVQGNNPACTTPACNIGSACALMLNASSGATPLARLATLYNVLNPQCTDVSFADSVAQLQNTSTEGATAMMRAWTYQTCTEFGFYQTCDPDSYCLFTSAPFVDTLDSSFELCELAFGITAAENLAAIDATNAHYGGWHPNGSRVLWVNGAIDPWHGLSVLEPLPGQPTYWVHGSSHHAWTFPPKTTDQASVIQARVAIAAQVQSWLDEAAALYGVTYAHLDPSWIPLAASGRELP